MPPDAPLRSKEMAEFLGVSRRQFGRWRRLKMPCHQVGESVVYFPDEVVAWLRDQPHPERQCARKSTKR